MLATITAITASVNISWPVVGFPPPSTTRGIWVLLTGLDWISSCYVQWKWALQSWGDVLRLLLDPKAGFAVVRADGPSPELPFLSTGQALCLFCPLWFIIQELYEGDTLSPVLRWGHWCTGGCMEPLNTCVQSRLWSLCQVLYWLVGMERENAVTARSCSPAGGGGSSQTD